MSDYPYSPAKGQTDTSSDAAEAIKPITARVQRLALEGIILAGQQGLTAVELADLLCMERTTVQPRISELRRLGRIEDSGERRHNPNRKRAIVWVVTGGVE